MIITLYVSVLTPHGLRYEIKNFAVVNNDSNEDELRHTFTSVLACKLA